MVTTTMKPFSKLALFLLVGTLQAFGSYNPHTFNSQNQFHFKPSAIRHAAAAKRESAQPARGPFHKSAKQVNSLADSPARSMVKARTTKPRPYGGNPTPTKIGFVSATQIAAGGTTDYPAIAADMNGDGKKDVVMMVGEYTGDDEIIFEISVLLSNSNGTFKPAVLTPVPGNDGNAQIVVGDVNGDGKADVIVGHSQGGGNESSSFDVLISNGDGTFTLGNNSNITSNPLIGGTLADVNGDGKLDVVVVDQNAPGNVWTALGNGDGTFQTATSAGLSGPAGRQTLLVDLNGDGLLDVADFDYDSSALTVFLATSATTYAQPASYTTTDEANDGCSLTAGDLNGDGKPELLAANCNQDNITVFLNTGNGAFQTGVYYASALSAADGTSADIYPEALSVADVNGDGKADVVVANDDGSDITILLGKGDGTLQISTVGYAVGGYPEFPPVIADFNGDGLADILVPDNEYSLVYMPGYGDGTFRAALDYYSPIADNGYAYGIGIATGDFNGDGQPDFVLGNCCDETVGITVFLSRPDGSLQAGVNYGAGDLEYVAVADFDGDGKLDIVAANRTTGAVQLFTGVGDGTFATGSTFATDASNTQPTDIVVGDFNHDGKADVAVINSQGQNVGVLINAGEGSFQTAVNYALSVPYTYTGIAAGDLNGDGNLDLAIALNSGSAIAVLNGNADGTFQPEVDVLTLGNPQSVTIADLNGDGKLDLAATVAQNGIPEAEGIAVSLGGTGGVFQAAVYYASSIQSEFWDRPEPYFIKAADIDGDGKTDLVYTNSEFGTVGVLYGAGDGTFLSPIEYPAGGYAFGLTLADVNQDGALDVVTAGDDFAGVTVLLNNNGSKTLPNFTVGPTETSQTVTAGSSATYTLMLTPSNFYNGTVTFSCGSLPAGTTCTFNPPSLNPNGNEQMSTQLTITTTASTSASLQVPAGITPRPRSLNLLASLTGFSMFGTMLIGSLKKKGNRTVAVLIAVAVVGMLLCSVGCGGASHGGSGSTGTPAGTYSIPVTASGTAGTNQGNTAGHTFAVSLTVQ
jgi:FG-GAP-like repeat